MSTLWHDLRYGLRTLLKNPGFTLTAVITLALGIGANTAIFSVVNALILNPLPFKNGERYVGLWLTRPQGRLFETPTADVVTKWRDGLKSFDSIEGYGNREDTLTGEGEPEVIKAGLVTPAMLSLLGVSPVFGRTISSADTEPGAERVALISYGLWKRRYGSDPQIVGKKINLRDQSYTVVGVLPSAFKHLPFSSTFISGGEQVLLPLSLEPQPGAALVGMIIGHLKSGTTAALAQAEMDAFSARLAEADPQYKGRSGQIVTIADSIGTGPRRASLVLLAAAGFVLLIACANVVNLLLARGATRSKEFAVRFTLGAGRVALLRQILIETLLLALAGGASGILLAIWVLEIIIKLRPDKLAQLDNVDLNGAALGFSLVLSILTSVLCGVFPAISASRVDLIRALKQGGRSSGGGQSVFRKGLIVAEVALSMVLLVGAGLLLRSFAHLQEINPGFDSSNVISMRLALPKSRYPTGAQQQAFFQQLLARIRQSPEVESSDLTTGLASQFGAETGTLEIEGRALDKADLPSFFLADYCGPDYFQVMRIPIREGSSFNLQDEQSPRTVLINEHMARRFWPQQSSLGHRIRFSADEAWRTIIGVTGDVNAFGRDRSQPGMSDYNYQIYYSSLQFPISSARIVTRAKRNASDLGAFLRTQVHSLDPNLPVREMKTMDQALGETLAQQRFNLVLLSVFAGLAVMLAAVGLYGLMSWSVSQSTSEIGIRMALGAQTRNVLHLVFGQGLMLTALGVGFGLAGAFALTRLMTSLLFGVKPTDAATFVAVPLVLIAIAVLACYVPARRATKVDPLVALRYE